jgi:hypothetical protein
LNREPLGEQYGNNSYNFINNKTIRYFDYLGLMSKTIPINIPITIPFILGKLSIKLKGKFTLEVNEVTSSNDCPEYLPGNFSAIHDAGFRIFIDEEAENQGTEAYVKIGVKGDPDFEVSFKYRVGFYTSWDSNNLLPDFIDKILNVRYERNSESIWKGSAQKLIIVGDKCYCGKVSTSGDIKSKFSFYTTEAALALSLAKVTSYAATLVSEASAAAESAGAIGGGFVHAFDELATMAAGG